MFGYVTFKVKYYILSQIFYKKNWANESYGVSRGLILKTPKL